MVTGASSAEMEREREACCREAARLEAQEVDMVSPCESRLLSVDMGLLEPSGALWKMLCVTCAQQCRSGTAPHSELACLVDEHHDALLHSQMP